MDIELFTLCDYAQAMFGKMTIVGAFDSIFVKQVPVHFPQCHVAARIRFRNSESGHHSFGISILSPDGKPVIPPLKGDVKIPEQPGRDSVINHIVLGIGGLPITCYGRHSIVFSVDGQELRTLPLFVAPPQQKKEEGLS
jgi:hypothetical protein